jgi:hypothetical protein
VRPNLDIETVQETDSPTGRPRHMYEAPVFRVRPGAAAVHWGTVVPENQPADVMPE